MIKHTSVIHPDDILIGFGGYIGRDNLENLAELNPDRIDLSRTLKIYSDGDVMSVLREEASYDINSSTKQFYLEYLILRNRLFYKE